MKSSVRQALEAYVADNPVFVFFHEDGQVEVISSYPYLSAQDDSQKAALSAWQDCLLGWVDELENGEISDAEMWRYNMPVSTKTHYYIRWFFSYVFRKLSSEPSPLTARWSWRASTAR